MDNNQNKQGHSSQQQQDRERHQSMQRNKNAGQFEKGSQRAREAGRKGGQSSREGE